MDIGLYRKYLNEYVEEAIQNSNGSISSISEYLSTIEVRGILTRHKTERRRALHDANKAFDEHRHWPLDIILSHLGVSVSIE